MKSVLTYLLMLLQVLYQAMTGLQSVYKNEE
jgi:hypothetical protein